MTPFPKMLLALQPEPTSSDLVDQAAEWAVRLGHTLDLATVVDPRMSVDPLLGADGSDTALVQQIEVQRKTLDWLHELSERIPKTHRGGVDMLPGHVLPALIEASDGIDLLIVGTHHRTNATRLFLGSVAEGIVRGAKSPVLVLTRNAMPLPEGPLIVRLPVDPADPNMGAIEWIAQHLPEAKATAVYALSWLRVFGPSPASGHTIYEAADAALRRSLAEGGHEALEHVVLVRQEMSTGDAIAHEATESAAHLVALPTHGRTGIARAVLGSVAERTVRAAQTAVLVVR